MKQIKVYQCSYCGYYKKTKSSVARHEYNCFYNPKNKACASCKHNIQDTYTVYDRDHGGDPGSSDYEAKCNWCEKKDIELTPETLRKNCSVWSLNEA